MVRLKEVFSSSTKTFSPNFNSTMVRLKAAVRIFRRIRDQFQFHYGTIKSVEQLHLQVHSRIFQFHYGTIKRVDTDLARAQENHFNSTMVRLKDIAEETKENEIENFNSTMVRLKDKELDQGDQRITQFQFHYGTIKRSTQRKRLHFRNAFQFHYGTIKSRKPDAGEHLRCQHFNSTMVRLKGFGFVICGIHSADFNSTMVRLKVQNCGCDMIVTRFQFHYGTIKRQNRLYALPYSVISIPLWYD